jgi:hypothetical protein
MIRPEILIVLRRWQEVILAASLGLFGLWLMVLGGYILMPIGAALVILALSMIILALRRLRFARQTGAIGIVEVDEAQIAYFGPTEGGFISLQDMVELRLLRLNGQQMWRLQQSDGQSLLIPIDATGAEGLFDAFAALPDMNTAHLVQELSDTTSDIKTIWRKSTKSSATQGAGSPLT